VRGYVRELVESFIDIGSGFILAIVIQLTLFPLFDLYPDIADTIYISIIFTVVSILRSWFWRNVFRKVKRT
jgi:hypothetical protein